VVSPSDEAAQPLHDRVVRHHGVPLQTEEREEGDLSQAGGAHRLARRPAHAVRLRLGRRGPGVRFETGEKGVVVGWRRLRTEDGGRTWTDSGADIPAQPTAIVCPAADSAVVATDAGSVVSVSR
jgi:hypothetical protein